MPADKALSFTGLACSYDAWGSVDSVDSGDMSRSNASRGSLPGARAWAPACWLLAACVVAACGGGLQPVHNVRHAPVVMAAGSAASPQGVHDAIMRALASRGWQLDREGPDGIVATVVSGGHSATVLIQHDAQTYSISYLDSSPGLKFNGTAIHRRYNDWIERLDRSIRKFLAASNGSPIQVQVAPGQPQPPPSPPGNQLPSAVQGEPAPVTSGSGGAPAATASHSTVERYDAPPPPPPAAAPPSQ